MGTKTQNTLFHEPYANLAYAIIKSGEHCNDTSFLQSDWCDSLRTMCELDDKMYGHRNIGTRGRAYVSRAHVKEAD